MCQITSNAAYLIIFLAYKFKPRIFRIIFDISGQKLNETNYKSSLNIRISERFIFCKNSINHKQTKCYSIIIALF